MKQSILLRSLDSGSHTQHSKFAASVIYIIFGNG